MSRNAGAVLFDLDDTLYPYRRFVLSGFAAVAAHLARTTGVDRHRAFSVLRMAWRTHRGRELQACVEHFALPATIVPALVDVMGAHQPSMRLPRSSTRTLRALREQWRTGVVTNGTADIQARKVDALGVRALVDTVVFASQHGTGRGKPEEAPFSAALARLDVPADRAVFVGNDEECDMVGAASVGMRTVLLVGPVSRTTCADAVVNTIADVPRVIASMMRRS